jgi:hypothetical protein
MVVGGGSLAPDVQAGVEVTVAPSVLAPVAPYTISIADASGGQDAEVTSLISLSFNADGTQNGKDIQGWSYGVCVLEPAKLQVLSATSAGTSTATINGGKAPGFESVVVNPLGVAGVTHGIVVDLFSVNKLPATNDWGALAMTCKLLMSADGDETFVVACDKTLGDPAVSNVVVIGGGSFAFSLFAGTDPADPEDGCVDPAACNKPGKFSFQGGVAIIPGNANGDARLDLADGIFTLSYLFRGGSAPPCELAADANGDRTVDASDAVFSITYLFLDGPPPVDGLGCQVIPRAAMGSLTCTVQQCTP